MSTNTAFFVASPASTEEAAQASDSLVVADDDVFWCGQKLPGLELIGAARSITHPSVVIDDNGQRITVKAHADKTITFRGQRLNVYWFVNDITVG